MRAVRHTIRDPPKIDAHRFFLPGVRIHTRSLSLAIHPLLARPITVSSHPTSMITSTIHSIVASAQPSREDFYAADGLSKPSMQNGWAMAVALITLVIIILLLSLIGKYLWNSCVCGAGSGPGLFTFAKRADNIWQILGLYILASLMFGGCVCAPAPSN